MFSQLLAAAASVALIGAGAVAPSSVRSADAMPVVQSAVADGNGAGASDTCRVDVVRTGQSGTVTTTRTVLSDHSCVCTVVTGPSDNNGNAEDVVTGMMRDRTCPDSPMVAGHSQEVAMHESSHNLIIPVLVGVVAAAGLAVALSSHNRDSQG